MPWLISKWINILMLKFLGEVGVFVYARGYVCSSIFSSYQNSYELLVAYKKYWFLIHISSESSQLHASLKAYRF